MKVVPTKWNVCCPLRRWWVWPPDSAQLAQSKPPCIIKGRRLRSLRERIPGKLSVGRQRKEGNREDPRNVRLKGLEEDTGFYEPSFSAYSSKLPKKMHSSIMLMQVNFLFKICVEEQLTYGFKVYCKEMCYIRFIWICNIDNIIEQRILSTGLWPDSI